jgi:hypothetical protein
MIKAKKAKLEGFIGPYFPWNIGKLNRLNRSVARVADMLLSEEESTKYKMDLMWGVVTSDGFQWNRNPLLDKDGIKIAVLFPFYNQDRSVAFYTKDKAGTRHFNEILRVFIKAFERAETKEYYRPFFSGRFVSFAPELKLPRCRHCKKKTGEREFHIDERRAEFVHKSCLFGIMEIERDDWVRGQDGQLVTVSYFIPGVTW